MSHTKTIAERRAENALERVTGVGDGFVMHLGSFRTDTKGGSVRATMAHHFSQHHGMGGGDELMEFFDPETGALVIVPESAAGDCPSMQGDER